LVTNYIIGALGKRAGKCVFFNFIGALENALENAFFSNLEGMPDAVVLGYF